MESSAEEEEPTQLCSQQVRQPSCNSSSMSRIRLLMHSEAAHHQQKSHVKKLLLFLILSTALFALSHICAVPSHNGFLQELDRRTPLNKSENLRNHQLFLFARNLSMNRKLLVNPDRMGDACTSEDVAILQGETGPLPDGIPSFTVQILNLCVAGCPISDIHVSCGWFASTKLINPKLFKRVKFNDCIVNDNLPLKGGDSIVFEYANSFQYPLEISSVNACCW